MTGLFGGSFDPPHVAHLIIAETVRDQFGLDRVIWIPAYRAPHKLEDGHSDARHRLCMTRFATQDNPHFTVSDIELRRAGVSYTVDTLAELQRDHPGEDFAFILGGDNLPTFHTWHRPQDILDRASLIVYARGGEEPARLHSLLRGRVDHADAPILDLSSTRIRRLRREGRSIRYLVPAAVLDYIEANGLYLAP